MQKQLQAKYAWSLLPLLFLFYVSVGGTHDYFRVNERRWEAYEFLKTESQVEANEINGGFEISCWNDGEVCRWRDFLNLDNFSYLIQFKSEEGFEIMREYPFQKYFPYRMDTLRIYRRQ